MDSATFTEHAGGVVITHQALSPKQGDTRPHTLYWTGPDPKHPHATYWSEQPEHAAVYPTEAAAADAFPAGNPWHQPPPPQLGLFGDQEAGRG